LKSAGGRDGRTEPTTFGLLFLKTPPLTGQVFWGPKQRDRKRGRKKKDKTKFLEPRNSKQERRSGGARAG